MKKLNYIRLGAALLLIATVSCVDMNRIPMGETMTEDQKDQVISSNPSRLQSDVNGLYSGLYKRGAITDWAGSSLHNDFGYASACMMYDASGMDNPCESSGYNWFLKQMMMTDRVASNAGNYGQATYFLWFTFYSEIKSANDILKVTDIDELTPVLKGYRAQALTARAFSYLNLVQAYQHTYKGNETKPGVPIMTEKTTTQEAANNPRATVKEVYDLIISDLNEAIVLFDGFSRSSKDVANIQVAYGLRARAHLNMEKWTDAAADAEKAAAGFTPQSIEEVSKPGFNKIASSWIWGIAITETADIVKSGVINFPSHMCSFTGNGYSPKSIGRYINNKLWAKIPSSDVRKGWWLDGEKNSPNVDWSWKHPTNGQSVGTWFKFKPYMNVKFGPYQNIYNNPTNACDFPLMRVEEMWLIRAEALAMGGNPAEGKRVLEEFVCQFRDPEYTCEASTPTAIQDEVWFQRRIELWGEGFSFFDLKRLKKPLERKGTNFVSTAAFNLPAESPNLLWIIPEAEAEQNKAIVNNEIVPTPKP